MLNNNQNQDPIEHLVIVGGGTAGWMAAAAISKVFQDRLMKITLIESDKIGIVGVGEATIPEITNFNRVLGIDENELLKFTNGTFKLGIEFKNWNNIDDSYIHPFGQYGSPLDSIPFFHHWQKLKNIGQAEEIDAYSLAVQACYNNKFSRPVDIPNSPLRNIAYAFHFDASLYSKFLRKYSEDKGVNRLEGMITNVAQDSSSGYIKELTLDSEQKIEADFFIDCSGFKGLLIEQTLHTGYEDWSHYLPCNSAITAPTPRLDPLPPYTRATAHDAGWQWRIPLQHRTGNGYVYSDNFISDDKAKETLLGHLAGEPLTEPKVLKFTTGKRRKLWNKNCVALGLSGGFMEPLESTAIHLVYEAISNFLGLFPNKTVDPALIEKFNAQQDRSFINIRDFLILHYKATSRTDSDFWNYCRTMDIPTSLQEKMDLYKNCGRIFRENNDLFGEASWLAVMRGQGITTQNYNPIADAYPIDKAVDMIKNIKSVIDNSCHPMPSHAGYVDKYCKSQPME